MIREGLGDKPEYVARVKEEMDDIKFLGFENYFLTMYDVFHLAEKKTLFGPCLLYTSPSPRDVEESRMPSSA